MSEEQGQPPTNDVSQAPQEAPKSAISNPVNSTADTVKQESQAPDEKDNTTDIKRESPNGKTVKPFIELSVILL